MFGQQSARTVRDIAVQIEQFRSVLGLLIRSTADGSQSLPTEVYLFDNTRAMEPYVPLYQGRPAPLAGYCHCGASDETSVIVASLADYAESSPIVYHEYTHLLLRNAVRAVPTWLNEGLAEYFSTFALRSDGRQAVVGAAIPRHVDALREGFIPLAQLLEVTRESPLYNERTRRSIFYAESWALTHYLLDGRPGGAETLNAFFADYASGADSAKALERATGVTLKTLESEVRRYVARPVFAAAIITLRERVEVDPPSAARALTAADAEARLAEIQLRVDRSDEAAPRIEAAAAARPPSPQAQLVLAKLRLRQQRDADALAALEHAAAGAPDDFVTQYLYGLTLLRGLGDLSDPRWPSERARLAREAFVRAVALRPDSPAALAWLAYADQETGTNLDEARDAARRAFALAPGRLDYALQLAEIDAQIGDVDAARQLLTPLLHAGDDSVARRAAHVLDGLDRAAALRAAAAREQSPAAPRETLDLNGVNYRLRELRNGERRTFGELLEIACGPSAIRFRVRTDAGEVALTAARMEDIELTAFGEGHDATIRCGPRRPPDKAYLTVGAGGSVVSVEFMPLTYVP